MTFFLLKKTLTWHTDTAVAATLINTGALVLAGVALALVDVDLAPGPSESLANTRFAVHMFQLYSNYAPRWGKKERRESWEDNGGGQNGKRRGRRKRREPCWGEVLNLFWELPPEQITLFSDYLRLHKSKEKTLKLIISVVPIKKGEIFRCCLFLPTLL